MTVFEYFVFVKKKAPFSAITALDSSFRWNDKY